ncbi:hypothetical protein GGI35DRAFT_353080 [Trichoderma velutinum]
MRPSPFLWPYYSPRRVLHIWHKHYHTAHHTLTSAHLHTPLTSLHTCSCPPLSNPFPPYLLHNAALAAIRITPLGTEPAIPLVRNCHGLNLDSAHPFFPCLVVALKTPSELASYLSLSLQANEREKKKAISYRSCLGLFPDLELYAVNHAPLPFTRSRVSLHMVTAQKFRVYTDRARRSGPGHRVNARMPCQPAKFLTSRRTGHEWDEDGICRLDAV